MGDVMHNCDAGSEACLNPQILNNFVKREQWMTCVKDCANCYTKNYDASTWIFSLIKT